MSERVLYAGARPGTEELDGDGEDSDLVSLSLGVVQEDLTSGSVLVR